MQKLTAILSIAFLACSADSQSLAPPTGSSRPAAAKLVPGTIETLATFDRDAGQRPEGIAIGPHGEIYVAMPRLGQIWEVDRNGDHAVFATIDPNPSTGAPGALGLAVDGGGYVYAALASFNPDTHGVYRISPAGDATRLDGSNQISWPNAIGLDERGNVYITDTCVGVSPGCGGAVWHYPDEHGGTSPWSGDPLLAGTGALHAIIGTPTPLGANGIAYWRHGLYVANTEQGSVVRIPIQSDGSAGEARVLAQAPALFTVDGITVDARGDVYAMVIGADRIIRIDRSSGELDVVADASDGLDQPVNAAFGTVGSDRHTLYIADYALFDFDLVFPTGRPDRPGAGVVSLWEAVPGR